MFSAIRKWWHNKRAERGAAFLLDERTSEYRLQFFVNSCADLERMAFARKGEIAVCREDDSEWLFLGWVRRENEED